MYRHVHVCTQDVSTPVCMHMLAHAWAHTRTVHVQTHRRMECTRMHMRGHIHMHMRGHTRTHVHTQLHSASCHIQAFSTSVTHTYRKYTRAQRCVPSATSKTVCACMCVCGACEEATGLLLWVSPEVGPMVLPANAPSPAQGPSNWAAAGCLPQKPGPWLGEGLDSRDNPIGVSPVPE